MSVVFFTDSQPMAPKNKKKNQLLSSSNKEASGGAIPWPNFPQQLLNLIGKQLHLVRNIGWGGVSKSWRAVPKKCSSQGKTPWLQLSDANDHINGNQQNNNGKPLQAHILNIPFYPGCYYWLPRRHRWPDTWMHFLGCSHGVVVSSRHVPDNLSLIIPLGAYISVSPWDTNIPFKVATLSTCYNDPKGCNLMVVTGISSPAFLISGLGRRAGWFKHDYTAWIKHDCALVDPYNSEKKPMKFTNVISFEGKFYALSLQGTLAVIEEVDSQFRITGIGRNRAVPSVSSRHFTEYLIESSGEILLIFLISKKSINIVDDVEMFRLDLARLSWVKMKSLKHTTLFLGTNCCMSIAASQVGCKSNCLYFTHRGLDSWLEYDMASGIISPCSNSIGCCTIKSPACNEPTSSW